MRRTILFLALLFVLLPLLYIYVENSSLPSENRLGLHRPYDMRVGTRYTKTLGDDRFVARLKRLKVPLFPGANSIWGATGRDDRGHIWVGVSVQGEDAARLVEYIPNEDLFVDHGDPIAALKSAGLYREGEKQAKIHSKIIQADDGYLYFASMDEHGEVSDGSRLPTWGSHFWRYDPQERRWEHLFKAAEGLIAVSGVGRWVYALGYWDHVLYQYDTHTGRVGKVRVGSEGGHVSRNFVVDVYGHVYVPRVKSVEIAGAATGDDGKLGDILVTSLIQFNTALQEVASTPLIDYAGAGKPRSNHGIVGLSYMADDSIVIVTGQGYLYRIIPSGQRRAEIEDLGWFHPEGVSYTAALFPLDGKDKMLGIGRRRGKGHELVEYDITRRSSRVVKLDIPKLRYLLLYGSNTRDDSGNFYIVGRHSWKTPVAWQLSIGPQAPNLRATAVRSSRGAPFTVQNEAPLTVQNEEMLEETSAREKWAPQERNREDAVWTIPMLVAIATGLSVLLIGVIFLVKNRASMFALRKARGQDGVSERYVSGLDGHIIEIDDSRHAVKLVGADTGGVRQVDYADIFGFEVTVNEATVLEVSRQRSDGLSTEKISQLRAQLLELQKEKMGPESIRRIDIRVTCALEPSFVHTLNFYFRQGNRRITPHSYGNTIENVLHWCELLVSVISPQAVGQIPTEHSNGVIDPTVTTQEETPYESQGSAPAVETASSGVKSLPDELEKLARLLHEGFLTEDEFQKAKKKLLGG